MPSTSPTRVWRTIKLTLGLNVICSAEWTANLSSLAPLLIVLLLGAGRPVWSQQATKEGEAVATQREASLKEMKHRLGWITFRLRQKDSEAKLKAQEKPLLRFNDPTREFN